MPKIIQEKDKCIGCGACASICPKYWEMSEDGKSNLKGSTKTEGDKYELETEKSECNQDAAESCPVQCIFVIE